MKKLLLILISFFSVMAGACQQPSAVKPVQAVITAGEFNNKLTGNNVLLVDVRTPQEFASGHIRGAINIDYNAEDFAARVSKLDASKTALLYCLSGGRSGSAMADFAAAGFKEIYNLQGGTLKWSAEGFPLVTNDQASPKAAGLSSADYEALTKSSEIVIVDFYATWCAPCKQLAPHLERAENENKGRLKVVKVDVDANRPLATSKRIDGIPFLEIYKNGKLHMQHEGYVSYEDLVKLLPL